MARGQSRGARTSRNSLIDGKSCNESSRVLKLTRDGQSGTESSATSDAMANARAPMDGRHEGEEGQHGTLSPAGLELDRLIRCLQP